MSAKFREPFDPTVLDQTPASRTEIAAATSAVTEALVVAITERFRSFGGGRDSNMNPLAHALKDHAPVFAAGVDIREVVTFVLEAVLAHAEGR